VGRIPALKPIRKILVANRGEIARRIFRTCGELGIATVAVYSDADRDAPHVLDEREAVYIGPAPSRDSYLSIASILSAAERTGADAIHPGYGFLAENAAFAEACEGRGIVFIGPRPGTIRSLGSKVEAREIAIRAGVPVLPSEGFPLLVKAAAGGGGKGMRRVDRAEDLGEAMAAATRMAISRICLSATAPCRGVIRRSSRKRRLPICLPSCARRSAKPPSKSGEQRATGVWERSSF
jgi:3-methylcrotonyl-CoA carboxylase alpha subunit